MKIMSGNGMIQALLIVLAMACPLGAQIARFQIQDGKLTIEEKSGRRHELPAEKVDEKSLRLSPDGRRLIYHLEFAGYGHDPRIPVKVWSADRPGHLAEFQVPTYSRYLDFVEWVDARRVLIGGDAYGVVLDVDKGEVERKIHGGLFAISPDRVKVACWKRFPNGTPPIISDRVMIAQLGEREWRAGPEVVQSEPGFYQVYPPDSELKEFESVQDMSRRRYAMSSFLWFSDSRRVAFVEDQDWKYWLVTVNIEIRDGVIHAGHERMVLPLSTADVPDGVWMAKDLSWRKQDEELSIVIYDRRLVVNLPRKTIRWETAR
jgi:hypothetical protein